MDDLISRQAAINRATKEHDFYRGAGTVSDKARRDELLNVMCWLGELPSVQPRTRGRWINHRKDRGHNIADCDQCGGTLQWLDPDERPNFCPDCGADMRRVRWMN